MFMGFLKQVLTDPGKHATVEILWPEKVISPSAVSIQLLDGRTGLGPNLDDSEESLSRFKPTNLNHAQLCQLSRYRTKMAKKVSYRATSSRKGCARKRLQVIIQKDRKLRSPQGI